MAKIKDCKNIDVDNAIRRVWGSYSGVTFDPQKAINHNSGQNGTDLILKYQGVTYYIEIEGLDSIGHVNESNFHRSFFRILTRMKIALANKNKKYKLVLAFPEGVGDGRGRRKNFGDVAWIKIAKAFPMLEFWRVDTKKDEIIMYPWDTYGS